MKGVRGKKRGEKGKGGELCSTRNRTSGCATACMQANRVTKEEQASVILSQCKRKRRT